MPEPWFSLVYAAGSALVAGTAAVFVYLVRREHRRQRREQLHWLIESCRQHWDNAGAPGHDTLCRDCRHRLAELNVCSRT